MVKKRRYKDSPEEEKYHVEVITKARVTKDREWEYYVKWAGYGSEADTWEPSNNVKGCERLLRSFWKHIGEDDEDYDVGATFEARPDWIATEKKYFHDNFGKEDVAPERRKKKKKLQEEPKKTAGKAQKKTKNVKKPTYVYTESSSSESENDVPMSKAKAAPPKPKATAKRIQSPESSDSDTPLRKAPRRESLASTSTNDKGKAPVRPRPETPPPPPTPHSDLHSLFSAPPTPEVTSLFSAPPTPEAPARTYSLPNIVPSNQPAASSSTTMPPPRIPAQTHKERQQNPRIKMVDLPTNVGQAIATKRKIAARTNSLQTPTSANTSLPIPYDQRKNPLKALHFKKKKPTIDTTNVGNANKAAGSPTQSPGHAASAMLPEADQVNSPISAHSGTLGRTSNSPAPAADNGGWGVPASNQVSTSGGDGWGIPASNQASTSGGGGWGPWDNAANTSSTSGWDASGWGDNNDSGKDADSGWGTGSWGVLEPDPPPVAGPSNTVSKPSPPVRSQSLENTTVQSRRSSGSVPIPRTNASPRTPSTPLQAAENFLANITLDGPPVSMNETPMNIDEPIAKPAALPAVKKTPLTQYQVVDKWQWTGELWVEEDAQNSKRLCNVRLSESTQPRPNGLRMSVCYTPTDPKLHFTKFYNTADIYALLDICAPIQQYCKVSHKDEADQGAFKTLTQFIARRHFFALSHSYVDDDPVGILVIFCGNNAELCAILKAPSQFRNDDTLLAAFIPCNLTYKQYQDYRWQRPLPSSPYQYGTLDPGIQEKLKSTTRRLAKNPELTRWFRLHRFTLSLYDFLTRAPRDYCMWTQEGSPILKNPDAETRSLTAILDTCKARNVGYKKPARLIFVHVAALVSFPKLPQLALRRMKESDMRVFSYGSDGSVSPERWGLREIYPIGGVMTFTPKAILEDPFEVYKLAELAREHPLWTCYIHPFTVAAVAKLGYPNDDAVSLIEKNDFFFLRLLELIEQGHLSLLYAPPLNKPPKLEAHRVDRFDDPAMDWTCWCTGLLSMGPKELMQECRTMLLAKHGKKSDSQLAKVVEQDILTDMVQMQRQPSLMDQYRRFVLITETRNDAAQEVDGLGVELAKLPNFDFRDDYFGRQRPS